MAEGRRQSRDEAAAGYQLREAENLNVTATPLETFVAPARGIRYDMAKLVAGLERGSNALAKGVSDAAQRRIKEQNEEVEAQLDLYNQATPVNERSEEGFREFASAKGIGSFAGSSKAIVEDGIGGSRSNAQYTEMIENINTGKFAITQNGTTEAVPMSEATAMDIQWSLDQAMFSQQSLKGLSPGAAEAYGAEIERYRQELTNRLLGIRKKQQVSDIQASQGTELNSSVFTAVTSADNNHAQQVEGILTAIESYKGAAGYALTPAQIQEGLSASLSGMIDNFEDDDDISDFEAVLRDPAVVEALGPQAAYTLKVRAGSKSKELTREKDLEEKDDSARAEQSWLIVNSSDEYTPEQINEAQSFLDALKERNPGIHAASRAETHRAVENIHTKTADDMYFSGRVPDQDTDPNVTSAYLDKYNEESAQIDKTMFTAELSNEASRILSKHPDFDGRQNADPSSDGALGTVESSLTSTSGVTYDHEENTKRIAAYGEIMRRYRSWARKAVVELGPEVAAGEAQTMFSQIYKEVTGGDLPYPAHIGQLLRSSNWGPQPATAQGNAVGAIRFNAPVGASPSERKAGLSAARDSTFNNQKAAGELATRASVKGISDDDVEMTQDYTVPQDNLATPVTQLDIAKQIQATEPSPQSPQSARPRMPGIKPRNVVEPVNKMASGLDQSMEAIRRTNEAPLEAPEMYLPTEGWVDYDLGPYRMHIRKEAGWAIPEVSFVGGDPFLEDFTEAMGNLPQALGFDNAEQFTAQFRSVDTSDLPTASIDTSEDVDLDSWENRMGLKIEQLGVKIEQGIARIAGEVVDEIQEGPAGTETQQGPLLPKRRLHGSDNPYRIEQWRQKTGTFGLESYWNLNTQAEIEEYNKQLGQIVNLYEYEPEKDRFPYDPKRK